MAQPLPLEKNGPYAYDSAVITMLIYGQLVPCLVLLQPFNNFIVIFYDT